MICKYNRDRFRRLTCRLYPRRTWCKNQINSAVNQPSDNPGQLVNGVRPLEVNQQVFTLDIAEFT